MSQRITDPTRMLPTGLSFELPEFLKCFVRGCYTEATIGRRHARFGCVDACQGHAPARFGQILDFGVAPLDNAPTPTGPGGDGEPPSDEQLVAEMMKEVIRLLTQGREGPDGGKGARLKPPTPKLPPTGTALPAPAAAAKAQGRAA